MENQEVTGPINLGNPEECTILDLAERIIRLCNSSSQIIHKPLPQDDPSSVVRISHWLKKNSAGRPEVALEHGLKQTIAYFQERLSNN